MAFGDRIKARREELALSRPQLADRLGVTPSTVSNYETGVSFPKEEMMLRLFDCLETDPNTLFQDSFRRGADVLTERERQLLEILVRLSLAEEAISDGREPYALELLETVADLGKSAVYYSADLEQRRLLLLARIPGQVVNLPGLDEALTVQATSALAGGDVQRAAHLLDGAEDRTAPCWNFLRGKCHMALEEFPEAAKCFLAAEGEYNVLRELEICYREMGDYKNAYIYACRQKDAQ